MSTRHIKRRRIVLERQWHCDGPKHEGETFMPCDAVTVSHGYGSILDGDEHHFCSLDCLCDWAAKDGRKALRKAKASIARYQRLEALVAGITPENVHPEIGTGAAVGKEFK
jgi:hypothetical protein